MKKIVTMTTATLLLAGVAHASGFTGENLSTMVTSGATTAPTYSTEKTVEKNEMIIVRNDAIIAQETGFISFELASVIEKLRHDNAEMAQMSDEEIVSQIVAMGQE